jgi:cytochrome c biogenesis protein CcmG/thiol:disulfide interchange protein DsbE
VRRTVRTVRTARTARSARTAAALLGFGLLAGAPLLAGCSDGSSADDGAVGVDLARDELGDATFAGLGDGAPDVALADFRGRPVVVNFWASTCAPCVREMPALEEVHRAAGDGLALVGIAVNDRVDAALELAATTGVTYPLGTDPRGEYFTDAGATLLPTTLVFDADGELRRRLTGEITAADLAEVLADETGLEVDLT